MTNPTAGDCRRALALIGHHTRGFEQGIKAIIAEANAAGRGTNLLMALLDAYQFITPELRTAGSLVALSQWVDMCAKQTTVTDWSRAASITIAHSTNDIDRFNALIIETNNEDSSGLLVGGILEMYAAILPELYTPAGSDAVSQWTARLSGREGDE